MMMMTKLAVIWSVHRLTVSNSTGTVILAG